LVLVTLRNIDRNALHKIVARLLVLRESYLWPLIVLRALFLVGNFWITFGIMLALKFISS
jgi:hypothetical protein